MSTVIPPMIYHADCLEVLTKMDAGIADLALIDPPYFDYKTGHRKDKASKLSQALHPQPRDEQLKTVQECIRILKDDRAFFFFTNWQEAWWFQQRFSSFLRNEIVWDKGNWAAGDLEGSLGCKWEAIFLGGKGRWKLKDKRLNDIDGWQIPRVGTDRTHPTEKPVALYIKLIELTTDEGDLVIDPYLGSGASMEAAILTRRNFIGCELDDDYYKLCLERRERCLKNL
jgi:site-specific DNA-methyltransferase (adenine-specific)